MQRAIGNLRGVGLGYIDFAISEPGWFELAFLTRDESEEQGPAVTIEDRVPPPFQLLLDALDELVRVGVLTGRRRAHAEWTCWSAVHGFAELATRGPLQGQRRADIDHLATTVVENTIEGVVAGRSPVTTHKGG